MVMETLRLEWKKNVTEEWECTKREEKEKKTKDVLRRRKR
jgi:hypothetical protein